jgi:hypothetical protein
VHKRIKGKKADLEQEVADIHEIEQNVGRDVLGEQLWARRDALVDEVQIRRLPKEHRGYYPGLPPREKKSQEKPRIREPK